MVRRELQQTREMKALNGAQGKAGDSLAKQRRISRSSSIGVGTKALLAAVVGIAFAAATLCSGRAAEDIDTHPFLRAFLEKTSRAATEAIEGDVESSCADPKRWLNSAGHDLLSGLPGFDQHNASMLWGTYRPGVYFGFKTRTSPAAVTGGLMWHGGDGRAGVMALRHECSEGDGLGPYGWVEHDGRSYGKQELPDQRTGIRLVTSMVKPAQLLRDPSADVDDAGSDVHLVSRVEVLPMNTRPEGSRARERFSTIYFYVGLDCVNADDGEKLCLGGGREAGGLVVVDSELKPRRSLLVRGADPQVGGFELEASVASMDDEGTVAFAGKDDVTLVDVKHHLEELHKTHRRPRRKDGDNAATVRGAFRLPDTVETGSKIVLLQFTGRAPFSVDFVIRATPGQDQPLATGGGRPQPFIPFETVTNWLATGSRAFSDRFGEQFSLEEKGFGQEDVKAAKAALSNMLGGMGYFTGRSEVRGAGRNGGNALSFGASLFTGVPSRSFFPRGFLWDEGFHQLLVSSWDSSTAIDVLGHWLSVIHVHDSGDMGCSGGWLPREQILGEEARRRVPAEFVAQDISVANPPTFLLLVDKLLGDFAEPSSAHNKGILESCMAEDNQTGLSDGCFVTPTTSGHERESKMEFFRKAHPLLDQWIQWLLVTQRPGAKGWGGGTGKAPPGAFQWRGRDPGDDRLNALTLASGLDDYPRASHPSTDEEWHVDVLSWLVLGCRVMSRLSTAVGIESLPYDELFEELVGGMFNLHWDEEAGLFFDHGTHASDSKLVDEGVMRCQKADGSTVDVGAQVEDIQTRKAVCAPGQKHMYPLGDGKGGLLTRRRWRGGSPRAQLVQHIGYVSIFPLLLKLLPPENQAVGRLLARMRDPTQLWSSHGLRSLSASDPLYQVENNPGDNPYWRGHIWVNVNYLALGALRHYSQAQGPFRNEADKIYAELRENLLRTLLGGYHSTGFFWEQYDDRSGQGLRSHPFTGWTALVVLIMAEIY